VATVAPTALQVREAQPELITLLSAKRGSAQLDCGRAESA
jgi:hypothetical protein